MAIFDKLFGKKRENKTAAKRGKTDHGHDHDHQGHDHGHTGHHQSHDGHRH